MQKVSQLLGLLLLLAPLLVNAQPEDDEYFYGFKAGVTYGNVSEIATSIIPAVFDENSYTVEDISRLGFTGSIFFYHRFRKSRFAIQPEISFSDYGGDFNYTDIEDLDYTIALRYQYLSFGVQAKVYPMGGLHFAIGPQVAFNVAPDNLTYTSNMPELGPDLQIQQSLREVLRGSNDINILLGAGYDFDFGLMIEARYRLGLSDVMETMANGFNFIENNNNSSGFQATIGWVIRFPDNR
ncbi:MAG: porin family protein [Bacteroidota bacterium]